MQKLAALAGVTGLGVVALLSVRGQAADRTGPAAVAADPMADIADLYAWTAGSNLNLVMDVSRLDDGTHSFDPRVQYVFHLTSKVSFGVASPGDTETRVILRFASNTSVELWVTDASGSVTKDYVSGDPSNPAGIAATDGRVKVFAGRRSDPAFFNPTDFARAATELGTQLTLPLDAAGCPPILAAEGSTIQGMLKSTTDAFPTTNVMAIVVQLDQLLVTAAPTTPPTTRLAVWASTHAGS